MLHSLDLNINEISALDAAQSGLEGRDTKPTVQIRLNEREHMVLMLTAHISPGSHCTKVSVIRKLRSSVNASACIVANSKLLGKYRLQL